jgi:hypothetical protein
MELAELVAAEDAAAVAHAAVDAEWTAIEAEWKGKRKAAADAYRDARAAVEAHMQATADPNRPTAQTIDAGAGR